MTSTGNLRSRLEQMSLQAMHGQLLHETTHPHPHGGMDRGGRRCQHFKMQPWARSDRDDVFAMSSMCSTCSHCCVVHLQIH